MRPIMGVNFDEDDDVPDYGTDVCTRCGGRGLAPECSWCGLKPDSRAMQRPPGVSWSAPFPLLRVDDRVRPWGTAVIVGDQFALRGPTMEVYRHHQEGTREYILLAPLEALMLLGMTTFRFGAPEAITELVGSPFRYTPNGPGEPPGGTVHYSPWPEFKPGTIFSAECP